MRRRAATIALLALVLPLAGCVFDTCADESDSCELCTVCVAGLTECDDDLSYDGRCDDDGECSWAIDDPYCE